MNRFHFLILGDEPRQKYLGELLTARGHIVMRAMEYLPGYHDAVLLPIPQTKKYLEANAERLQKGQIVYGCRFPCELRQQCEERGIAFVDYMEAEGVSAYNAVATAEGAVAEALQGACVTIHGSRCLVAGYGCCGEVLSERLLSLNADVTVMERKEEKRARARAHGCRAVSFSCAPDEMGEYDYIFNTVPALVFTAEKLSRVKPDVRIIDIASAPGGVDYDFCQKREIQAKLCPGLPGKYAPKSSAGILVEVIGKTILGER